MERQMGSYQPLCTRHATVVALCLVCCLVLATCDSMGTKAEGTITFDPNGGTGTMSPQVVTIGTSACLESNAFTKSGYSFAGWATSFGGDVVYADGATYNMKGTVTLYAKWGKLVIFDPNGGTGTMSPQAIAYGAYAFLKQNTFTRPGYVFSGWNMVPDGRGYYNCDCSSFPRSSAGMTENATVYAQWVQTIATDVTSTASGLGTSFVLKPVTGGAFSSTGGSTADIMVSSFYMSQYHVTRANFSAVMGADPSNIAFSSGTNDPVQVTWYMAIAFCNKLSLLDGLTPVYTVSTVSDWPSLAFSSIPSSKESAWDRPIVDRSANGYRLPTEAEYMWAAIGGASDSRSGDIVNGMNIGGYSKGYAGSNEPAGGQTSIGDYAWYSGNYSGTTHPVGLKKPNEMGIHDLTGNVYSWCWDAFSNSGLLPGENPQGPEGLPFGRVLRGSTFGSSAYACVLTERWDGPLHLSAGEGLLAGVGFRVVRSQ